MQKPDSAAPDIETPVVRRKLKLPQNLTFFLVLLAVLLVHFALLRAGMIVRNRASLHGATTLQIARSFITGAQFDAATACYLLLPFAVLAHVPGISFDRAPRVRRAFFWCFIVLIGVLTFACMAEFEFFNEFQTRFNQLALQYLNQPRIVGGMVWYNYPVVRYVLVWAAWIIILGAVVRRLMRWSYDGRPSDYGVATHVGAIIALFAVFVICMRGGFGSEPLRWGNAFTTQNEFTNQMGLNGLYTLGNTLRNEFAGKNVSEDWTARMDMADARAVTRELLVEPDETLTDPANRTVLRGGRDVDDWLVIRPDVGDGAAGGGGSGGGGAAAVRGAAGTKRPPNVVLVVMESFSGRFVGAAGAPGNFTPCFDGLARDGVFFSRAFSAGTHTHQGVFASVLGFPNLPGYEYLMESFAGNQAFSSLPSILKSRGYDTHFIYNGNLEWDNMHGFLRKQGITHFVGGDSFGPEIRKDRVWGVSDKDMLDRANAEFEKSHRTGRPFFGLVLTLSNHAPFDVPEPLPFPRTTGMGELNKRMDAMRYADWAIGHFIEGAKRLEYFDNTMFVFVGDHGFHVAPKLTDVHLTYHHVPLLFYGPRLLSRQGVVSRTVVNQVNIAPSILGLLNIDTPAAHWARNVFENDFGRGDGGSDDAGDNFAVFKGSGGDNAVAIARGDLLFVLGDDGQPRLYRYDLGFPPSVELLSDPASVPTARRMRRELEGYVQAALNDLTTYRAGPAAKASASVAVPVGP